MPNSKDCAYTLQFRNNNAATIKVKIDLIKHGFRTRSEIC
jgi:hypothetical protein